MPIISITSQPLSGELKAAYRPIRFIVKAKRTDLQPIPPVVYCDVYVNGIFYKTISKTQYTSINDTDVTSSWDFDIQDIAQEVLIKVLAPNGGTTIISATGILASAYCRFRSSGYSGDGFLIQEGTIPVQKTGTTPAIAGTGFQSGHLLLC